MLRSPRVWVKAAADAPLDDVVPLLRAAWFDVTIAPQLPAAEESPSAIVVPALGLRTVEETKVLRAGLAGSPVPILWLVDEETLPLAAEGLKAGAEACLIRPVHGDILVGQVQALIRARDDLDRFARRGADAGELTDRVHRLFRQIDDDAILARAILEGSASEGRCDIGDFAMAWSHSPDPQGETRWLVTAKRDGQSQWAMVEVGGVTSPIAMLLAQRIASFGLGEASPAELLHRAEVAVRSWPLPEAAMLAAGFGQLDGPSIRFALAGVPVPTIRSEGLPPQPFGRSGAFLGSIEGTPEGQSIDAKPGEAVEFSLGGAAESGSSGTSMAIRRVERMDG